MTLSRRSSLALAAAVTFGLPAAAFAQTAPTPTAAPTTTQACTVASTQQVAALFDRWNDSLRSLDPDQVTANYAPDGVLLPTVSNQPRTSPAEIRDYFVSFLKNEPQGKIDKRIVKVGCNLAQDIGTYTFKFKGGQTVQARYTFVYEWVNGQWLIAHHHSSAMPQAVATASH